MRNPTIEEYEKAIEDAYKMRDEAIDNQMDDYLKLYKEIPGSEPLSLQDTQELREEIADMLGMSDRCENDY